MVLFPLATATGDPFFLAAVSFGDDDDDGPISAVASPAAAELATVSLAEAAVPGDGGGACGSCGGGLLVPKIRARTSAYSLSLSSTVFTFGLTPKNKKHHQH